MGGEQRRPSAGTVRVHEVQLAHILEYLNALPSLDEDGAILLGEGSALRYSRMCARSPRMSTSRP